MPDLEKGDPRVQNGNVDDRKVSPAGRRASFAGIKGRGSDPPLPLRPETRSYALLRRHGQLVDIALANSLDLARGRLLGNEEVQGLNVGPGRIAAKPERDALF